MNNKAMFNISYGLYVLTAKEGDKLNGCITNTLIQVTTEPNRVSITVNKGNYTHDMVMRTGEFNVSMLSEEADFSIFTHFGFQSGRDVDKFADYEYKTAANGIPYVEKGANAYLCAKVCQTIDLGTHTMFIADVTDADVISDVPSATYTYYHKNIKPAPAKPAGDADSGKWVCKICGYVYDPEKGDPDNGIAPGTKFEDLPADWTCPICKHGKVDFEKA